MPYRRLPNTDQARLRAMEKALRKCLTDTPTDCPISETTLGLLEIVLPKFQHALINLSAARKNQISKNKEYLELVKKAKIYISHFIQVLNFSIARGELKAEVRDFYGLTPIKENLPPLTLEKNLLEWGKKIIEGEQKRLQKGGNPIYNPSIALVKVNFEKFSDSYVFQKNLITISKRATKLVNDIRPEVDNLILQVWNEIENYFMQPDETTDREKTQAYGLVYVFRKHEKQKKSSTIELIRPLSKKEESQKPVFETTKEPELISFMYSPKQVVVQSTLSF
jgi:hypothetical protein